MAPNVAHEQGVSLSGNAKLEDGNRLILLLATGSLLDHKVLSKIAESGEGEGAGTALATAGEETKPGDKIDDEPAISLSRAGVHFMLSSTGLRLVAAGDSRPFPGVL